MAPLIRRRALEAAAKVALSLSAAACSSTGLDARGQMIPSHLEMDTTVACNAPPPPLHWSWDPPFEPRATEATVTCCRDFLSKRLPDGGGPFSDEHRANPEVQACCTAIVQDPGAIVETRDRSVFWPCCWIREISGALACNPWGPPVPPAMPSEWSDAWEIS